MTLPVMDDYNDVLFDMKIHGGLMSLKLYLDNVRRIRPTVHCITSAVSANDCANALIACGARGIMSDQAEDAVDITAHCGGLNISIGTLYAQSIKAMFEAGDRAGELGRPILLDPLGAGTSALRTKTAHRLAEDLPLTVIRGNLKEIKILASGSGSAHAVPVIDDDHITKENLASVSAFIKQFAEASQCVVAVSGETDIISDGNRLAVVQSGDPMMSDIAGCGSMVSAVTTAFVIANPEDIFMAVTAAFTACGVCGEIAKNHLRPEEGNASFRNRLIDAIYHLNGEILDKNARYEIL